MKDSALWVSKQILLEKWEGLNLHTLNRLLAEMRRNLKYRHSVINPTHKLVFIKLSDFEDFMRWKQKQYYKPQAK